MQDHTVLMHCGLAGNLVFDLMWQSLAGVSSLQTHTYINTHTNRLAMLSLWKLSKNWWLLQLKLHHRRISHESHVVKNCHYYYKLPCFVSAGKQFYVAILCSCLKCFHQSWLLKVKKKIMKCRCIFLHDSFAQLY